MAKINFYGVLVASMQGSEDSYIWHATSSGVYSTKSGYFAASTPWLEKSESIQAENFIGSKIFGQGNSHQR